MNKRIAHFALVLALVMGLAGTAAAAPPAGMTVMIGLPFSFLVIGIFAYLVAKERYLRDVYQAAIEQGTPVPEKPVADYRKPALILCAVGAGYGIAIATVFVAANKWHVGLGAGAWGIIPVLLGAALWKYGQLAARDRERLGHNE